MSRDILDALKKKYEAEVDIAKATIQIYLDKPVGIGEHPQFFDEITRRRAPLGNLNFKQPIIMGIVNLTPDSFSDGGKFNTRKKGIAQAINLYKKGADLIDVGGESTRPGSMPVKEKDEWNRINKILKLTVNLFEQ